MSLLFGNPMQNELHHLCKDLLLKCRYTCASTNHRMS